MNETDFSLSEHHRDLEAHFEQLVTRCQGGDPIEIRCEWSLFERELREHMDLEEKALIPPFRREHPAEAAMLLREHAEIRLTLAEMGISLDLHALRADAVADFIARLRIHAGREEELFYPWMAAHLAGDRWMPRVQRLGTLTRNIGAAFGAAGAPSAHSRSH
jgi:hypothetical protein